MTTPAQVAYQALHESIARRQPAHIWLNWDAVNEVSDGIPGEPVREDIEAAAQAATAPVEAERDKAYRERAHLVAFLAACYPSVIMHDADENAPGWSVIFVTTPSGQMSWHLAESDLDLFRHVAKVLRHVPTPWDGHSTEEKYQRLAEMTARLSAADGAAGLVAAVAAPAQDGGQGPVRM